MSEGIYPHFGQNDEVSPYPKSPKRRKLTEKEWIDSREAICASGATNANEIGSEVLLFRPDEYKQRQHTGVILAGVLASNREYYRDISVHLLDIRKSGEVEDSTHAIYFIGYSITPSEIDSYAERAMAEAYEIIKAVPNLHIPIPPDQLIDPWRGIIQHERGDKELE